MEAITCVGAERWATSNIRDKEIRDVVEAAGGKFLIQLSEISQEGTSKRGIESSPGLNQAHFSNSNLKRGDKKRRSSSPVTEGSILGGGGGEESRSQHQLLERMEEATRAGVDEFEKMRNKNIFRNSQFLWVSPLIPPQLQLQETEEKEDHWEAKINQENKYGLSNQVNPFNTLQRLTHGPHK